MQIGLDSFTHFPLCSRMQLMLNACYSGTNPQYFIVLGVGHQKNSYFRSKGGGSCSIQINQKKLRWSKKGEEGSQFLPPLRVWKMTSPQRLGWRCCPLTQSRKIRMKCRRPLPYSNWRGAQLSCSDSHSFSESAPNQTL